MVRQLLAAMMVFAATTSAAAQQSRPALEGVWRGVIDDSGTKLRLIFEIGEAEDGGYRGTLISVDQGEFELRLDGITYTDERVWMGAGGIHAEFNGTMSKDGQRIRGAWDQLKRYPLELVRDAKGQGAARR